MAAMQEFNQQEGDPRIRIGNWVEERALMQATGQSRGSTTASRNLTGPRVTGPVTEPLDYATTTLTAHQQTLVAPHGPKYIDSVAPPRRGQLREAARMAEAEAIMAERARLEAERLAAEMRTASFGARDPQNRKRAIASDRSLDVSAQANPLNGQAITFHSHNITQIHGVTPTDRGVHTFGRNTHFSKPLAELHESGER